MKNSKTTILICGLLAIMATVVFYLLTFDTIFNIPMRWVSLLFLIIAECIGTLKAMSLKQDIISQASVYTSVLHIIAVLILSIVFVNFLPFAFKPYLLLNILMLCALAAIDLFISHFGKNASADDKKLAQSQNVLLTCHAKVQSLVTVYGQSEYKNDLVAIADLIKYSDNSDLTGDEMVIMNKLDALEAQLKEEGADIQSLITEIKNAIDLRSIKMKTTKRGGY